MRETRGKVLDGVRALALARVRRARVLPCDIADDHDDGAAVWKGAKLEYAALGVGDLDLAGGLARPAYALGGGVQQAVPVPARQHVAYGLAAPAREGTCRQTLGNAVGIHQHTASVYHEHPLRKRVEDGLQKPDFVGKGLELMTTICRIELVDAVSDFLEKLLHVRHLVPMKPFGTIVSYFRSTRKVDLSFAKH